MRTFLSVLTGLSLLSPLAAHAEFTTPQDVLTAVESGSEGLPFDFSGELHGHYENYYLSAWLSGSGQKEGELSRSSAKITVDFASNGNTVRGKLQTRMVEKKMYLLLEGLSGKLENEIAKAVVEVTGKKWIQSDIAQMETDTEYDAMQRDMLADVLRVDSVKTDSVGNTLYTLTLTRDAARELSKSLREMASGYVGEGVTPRMNVTIKITLDRNNMLIKATADATVEAGPAGLNASFTVSRRSSGVSVTAPANAVDAESLYGEMFGIPVTPWNSPAPEWDSSDWDSGSDSGWDSNWEMPAVPEPPSSACTLSEIRLGNCQVQRQSRRMLYMTNSSSSAAVAPEGTRVPDFSAADYYKGDVNADVTLLEYGDLQCPFCARYHETLNQVLTDYQGRVNVVFRHYPLSFHNNANTLANAAECIGEVRGATGFWKFLDYAFAANDDIADYDMTDMEDMATNLGVDKTAFRSCMDESRYQSVIDSQMRGGTDGGVMGTPHTILVNHRTGRRVMVSGAVPYETLKAELDAILR